KPDRVVKRIFARLGLAEEDATPMVMIDEGRKFAQATGLPIRYIDIIFVYYGQMQAKEVGLEHGICLEKSPSCEMCGAKRYCDYYARRHGVNYAILTFSVAIATMMQPRQGILRRDRSQCLSYSRI